MRTLAIITAAVIGLGFASPSFAQSSQSAPQTGLPPGAGYGAINAQPPPATGEVVTTPTGGTVAPSTGSTATAAPAPRRHYTYRVRRAHRRARTTTTAPSTTAQ